jgi:DNA-binding transcriptional LysR family regulator
VTSHSVDIPSLLADFHDEHPNVEITLSTASSDALIEKVHTGRLDAAIVSSGPLSDRRALTLRWSPTKPFRPRCA